MRDASISIQNTQDGGADQSTWSEPSSASKTGVMPVLRLSNERNAPAAETGTVEVVSEGRDNTDEQDATRTTAEQQPSPAHQEEAIMSPSILIVEDNTELAEVIAATLERLNMRTTQESHGSRALARFTEVEPDVVLLDIGLPDMTGWKMLEDLKERNGASNIPKVIIITAYGDPANRLIGKLQNVHDYLIKPFTSDEVERVVLGALDSARA